MATRVGPVGATLGIVGAGQLARMTYEAGIRLGIPMRVLASGMDDSAVAAAADVSFGRADDADALAAFADRCQVITFDHERVDLQALEALAARGFAVRPGPATIRYAVDKLAQRERLAAAGLPVPRFATVRGAADVSARATEWGWPVVLKAVRGGYDGRGVWVARDEREARVVLTDAGRAGVSIYVEEMLTLDTELAVVVARNPGGEVRTYPVVETVQVDGMCHEVRLHDGIDPALAGEAMSVAHQIAKEVDSSGVLAVELFVSRGRVLVNELATRPHNSGHWTIEGAVCSQFENHVRGVLDMPLGSVEPTAPVAVMLNVVGPSSGEDPSRNLASALAVPGAHVHLYGKAPRPGRKLGHVTVLGEELEEVRTRAAAAVLALTGERPLSFEAGEPPTPTAVEEVER